MRRSILDDGIRNNEDRRRSNKDHEKAKKKEQKEEDAAFSHFLKLQEEEKKAVEVEIDPRSGQGVAAAEPEWDTNKENNDYSKNLMVNKTVQKKKEEVPADDKKVKKNARSSRMFIQMLLDYIKDTRKHFVTNELNMKKNSLRCLKKGDVIIVGGINFVILLQNMIANTHNKMPDNTSCQRKMLESYRCCYREI